MELPHRLSDFGLTNGTQKYLDMQSRTARVI
jgi:hypothetical protein